MSNQNAAQPAKGRWQNNGGGAEGPLVRRHSDGTDEYADEEYVNALEAEVAAFKQQAQDMQDMKHVSDKTIFDLRAEVAALRERWDLLHKDWQNRMQEATALRVKAERYEKALREIRIAHSKHHALTVDALLTAALDAAQKGHEP